MMTANTVECPCMWLIWGFVFLFFTWWPDHFWGRETFESSDSDWLWWSMYPCLCILLSRAIDCEDQCCPCLCTFIEQRDWLCWSMLPISVYFYWAERLTVMINVAHVCVFYWAEWLTVKINVVHVCCFFLLGKTIDYEHQCCPYLCVFCVEWFEFWTTQAIEPQLWNFMWTE